MAPFSMRCNSCGEYIYKGKKFNARKETVLGEDYMGIKVRSFPCSLPPQKLLVCRSPRADLVRIISDPLQIFRFYIKCTLCSTEITFKTDPKNADYTAEHGASRNFEVCPFSSSSLSLL